MLEVARDQKRVQWHPYVVGGLLVLGLLIFVVGVDAGSGKLLAGCALTIAAIGGVLLLAARPIWGLAAIIFHGFSLLPNFYLVRPLTIRSALVLFTVLGFLLREIFLREPLYLRRLLKEGSFHWLAAYYAWAIMNMSLLSQSMEDAHGMVNNLLLFALLLIVPRKVSDVRKLVVVSFVGCVVVATLGWIQFFRSPVWTYPIKRIDGIYGNEIVMALHSLMGLCLGLGLLSSARKGWQRVGILGGIAIAGAMTLSAASRGVTVAAITMGLVIAMARGARAKWFLPLGVAGGVAVLWIGWEPMLQAIHLARHTATNVFRAAELSSGRIYLYQAALRLLVDDPRAWIIGIGWGMFKERWFVAVQAPIIDARGVPRLNVHCSYLQILVELGTVGVALYGLWTASYLTRLVRAVKEKGWVVPWARTMVRGILLAIVALLLHSAVDNNGRGNDRAHVTAVALAIVAVWKGVKGEERDGRKE